MLSFRDAPLRRKLTVISTTTSAAALLLACAVIVVFEQASFRREMARNLATTAELIGFNTATALAFNDASAAEQTLKGLATQPHIMAACVYDPANHVFATYQRDPGMKWSWPAVGSSGESFEGDSLKLFHPVENAGEKIGTIYVESDLTALRTRLVRYAVIAGGALLLAVIAAWLIASRLQRVISGPITDLAGITGQVAAKKDYTVRATKAGEDEIGRLVDGFNHMLAQIEEQAAALQTAYGEMEQRVERRTVALKRAQDDATEKAAQLRFIFEAVPFSVTWILRHADRNEFLVNQAFFRITGLDPGEPHRHESVRALTHPDDLKRQDEWRARLDRGEIDEFALEKRYIKPEGTIVWVWFTLKVYRGAQGESLQEVSTLIDITARKEAEVAIEQMHRQLLETSRRAGMAEVATGVLHNVGNVLNSVNVSATLVTDLAQRSKVRSLEKIGEMLQQHESDLGAFLTADPKGKLIPAYLATLGAALVNEHGTMIAELRHLHKNIGHIKDIVAMQQNYAKTSGVTELVSAPDLVEDALKMNAGSLARHEIEIVREYEAQPVLTLEKHKVLQVLVNLIGNAKHACDDSGRTDKRLRLRITADEYTVAIAITDNGVGIPPENLTRIFAHGFTTRKHGHGFGLHSGALTAKELGGSLTVQSEGVGRGATFILKLPFKPGTPPEQGRA